MVPSVPPGDRDRVYPEAWDRVAEVRVLRAKAEEPAATSTDAFEAMMLRTSILALSICAAGAAWAPPASTKYRVDYKSHQIVDLSPFGQGEQRQSFGWSSFLKITLTDTAGGRTMHAVVDSISVDSGSQIPAGVFDSVKGAAWLGFVSPEGRVSGLKMVERREGGEQLQGVLASFYPRVKKGAKVGDKWTDTLDVARESGNSTMSTRTVTNYTLSGTETRAGSKALRIDAAFSLAQTGVVESPQGAVNLDGTGTGTGSYYVATDGRFLGGSSTTKADITAVVPSAPSPIAIKDSSTITVTPLP